MPLPNKVAETAPPAALEPLTLGKSGSDFMVDVIKTLGFEYMAANPASSFRGLHESLINYGGNESPEFLTCSHEEISVAMGHGYFKIEGKPLCVFAHGAVGLQHATMALYNAWCDRVPVYMVIGNILDATMRRPGVEWNHTVQDAAAIVRDYVKWDDYPASLQHFAESSVRAYKIMMTPPTGSVVIVADATMQEDPIPEHAKLRIPKLPQVANPQGDSGAVAETARLLVNAENPVIIADRYARTPTGSKHLVALAEVLQCAIIDTSGRLNMPSRHPLNQSSRARGHVAQADVVLGLEMSDFWNSLNSFKDGIQRTSRHIAKADARTISIGTGDLYIKSNYQDFQRFEDIDLAIAADAEATMPALIEAVKKLVNGEQKAAYEARGKKLAAGHRADFERSRLDATFGWNDEPDHHRAAVRGAVGPDQGRGLVAGIADLAGELLAAAAVDDGQALPVHRRRRRHGHRLCRLRLGRRGARQPQAWPPHRRAAARRRPPDDHRRAVDRRASQDSRSSA